MDEVTTAPKIADASTWREFATAAIAGVAASEPWWLYVGAPARQIAHCAANVADAMLDEYKKRFGQGT